ncbi:hypothetical protein TWF730_001513 [Orbilia blumenaviensis]|uniref:AAA+ ATPase domain-containing protein n=1 Tax=Orbilia blumenaviensis TaxID=1796055 RepID=A0AAV9UIT0_9PEZI
MFPGTHRQRSQRRTVGLFPPGMGDSVIEEPFEEVREDEGFKNEVKFLESRYDGNSYPQLYEVGSAPPKYSRQADLYGNFTFRSTTFYNECGFAYKRSVDILSKPVLDALKDLIVGYPGVSFSQATFTMDFPLDVFWYYQDELNELAKAEAEKDTELGQHLEVLMKFLNEEFQDINKEYKDLTKDGLINYDLAWTLFTPGALLFTTILMQPRVLKLKSIHRNRLNISIQATYVDYDGTKFGEQETTLQVWAFDGVKRIEELSVFSLDWHPEKDEITRRLIERGTKLVSLQGSHCKKYNGLAVEMTMFRPSKVQINSRVMIDAKTHAMFNASEQKHLMDLNQPKPGVPAPRNRRGRRRKDDYYADEYDTNGNQFTQPVYHHPGINTGTTIDFDDSPHTKRELELTDEQKLLCNATIYGFTLDSKKWLQFFIEQIEEVVWNTDSFSKLVLPEETKELICGLVESHITDQSHFDDFVEGKGKGLISVLHGAPGLGKTMTAETVAEYTKSPLYTVSAGSLGTDAITVERNLERILQLCTIWKAVLLLDEADVYLEQRSLHDINRNALVSIFLRLLEYYHGILFLTSNRVETFDEAIQSRIHIAIRYNELTPEARVQVWKNFVHKIENSGTKTEMKDEDYEALMVLELNGRQIKNATRTALGIADRRGEKLCLRHLKLVLGVVDAFEKDMATVKKVAVASVV